MVSVEAKSDYIRSLRRNQEVTGFVDLLFRNSVDLKKSENISDPAFACNEISASICYNDSDRFLQIYSAFSAKNPTVQSPWIHNEILIFLLACGATKFNCEKEWLHNAIELGNSSDNELRKLKKTLILLLTSEGGKHEYSFKPVEFVFREFTGQNKPIDGDLIETYKSLAAQPFPYYESDFLNLICLKAIDLIVEWKGLNQQGEMQKLNQFAERFKKRTSTIGKTLFAVILLVALGGLCYLGFVAFQKPDDKNISLIISLVGTAGFSAYGLIQKWHAGHEWVTKIVRTFLGFK